MKTYLFLPLLLTAALTTAACSDDDTPDLPAGTVTLNMLDEENGGTELAGSGIRIDAAQNFTTQGGSVLFVTGRAGSLGGVSTRRLETPTQQAAVEPGCGYVAVRPQVLVEFPSGRKAISLDEEYDADMIRFRVAAALEKEGKRIGAAVQYVIERPNSYGLPAFGSTVLELDPSWGDERSEGVLTLPTSDFEYDFHDEYGQFKVEKRGGRLHFRLDLYRYKPGSFPLWLRIHESCTKVWVKVI